MLLDGLDLLYDTIMEAAQGIHYTWPFVSRLRHTLELFVEKVGTIGHHGACINVVNATQQQMIGIDQIIRDVRT